MIESDGEVGSSRTEERVGRIDGTPLEQESRTKVSRNGTLHICCRGSKRAVIIIPNVAFPSRLSFLLFDAR